MDIKAFIFDQDETLLRREVHYEMTFEVIARRFGKTFDPTSDLRRRVMGVPWKTDVIPDMIQTLDLPITVEEYDAWAKAILNTLAPTSQLMPGVELTLWWLVNKGYKLAIATSCAADRIKPSWTCDPEMLSRFDVVVAGDDPAVKQGKPAPDMLLMAAERLGVKPSECVYVGDNPVDHDAAKAAGMLFIAVPNYLRKPEEFETSFAIVDSLENFPFEKLGIEIKASVPIFF